MSRGRRPSAADVSTGRGSVASSNRGFSRYPKAMPSTPREKPPFASPLEADRTVVLGHGAGGLSPRTPSTGWGRSSLTYASRRLSMQDVQAPALPVRNRRRPDSRFPKPTLLPRGGQPNCSRSMPTSQGLTPSPRFQRSTDEVRGPRAHRRRVAPSCGRGRHALARRRFRTARRPVASSCLLAVLMAS